MNRALDLLVASLALVVLLPVFVLIAMAVKLDSRGPVFVSQSRRGRDGRHFRILKFRSLHCADNEGHGPGFHVRNEPRVTRVGRFLRPCCLDELPQLWSVLLGDVSLVSPRPPNARESS